MILDTKAEAESAMQRLAATHTDLKLSRVGERNPADLTAKRRPIESGKYVVLGTSRAHGGREQMILDTKAEAESAMQRLAATHTDLKLSRVGERNPADLTAKGERMYRDIKVGYAGDPRAKEIAARTVRAAAGRGVPGLIRRRNPGAAVKVGDLVVTPDNELGRIERIDGQDAYIVHEDRVHGRGPWVFDVALLLEPHADAIEEYEWDVEQLAKRKARGG
jgi:hypothetical protein